MEPRVHRDGEEWSDLAGPGLDKLVAQVRELRACAVRRIRAGEAKVSRAYPWLELAGLADEAYLKCLAAAEQWGGQWAGLPMAA